jgi:hypothetical protein
MRHGKLKKRQDLAGSGGWERGLLDTVSHDLYLASKLTRVIKDWPQAEFAPLARVHNEFPIYSDRYKHFGRNFHE